MNTRRALTLGVIGALALGTLGLVGCGTAAPTDTTGSTGGTPALSGALTVAGSDTMVNMAQAWADGFSSENPGVQLAVKGGGSGTGIAGLLNGTVDFANASREIKQEEVDQAKAKGIDPVVTQVARDGVAIIVNSANKVEGLTMDQLAGIYLGTITNWKAVGGADAPITLVSRDPSSGTYEFVTEKVLDKGKFAKSAKLLGSTQLVVDEVKADPNSIGYIGVGYESAEIKVVAVDGVKASVATVKDESYPLFRYLNMYSNGEPTGVAKAYIEWILSPAGQAFVTEQGFVSVK